MNIGTHLRCTLFNGVVIEAKDRNGIEAGLDGWNSFVKELVFVDGDGQVICPAEIPAEWDEVDDPDADPSFRVV